MSHTPIVITGAGIVAAIGNDCSQTLRSLLDSKSGIAPLRYLATDHHEFPVGEVKLSNDDMADIVNVPKHAPVTRTSLMGMMALDEALRDAALSPSDLRNVSFVSGTTVGGMDKSEQYYLDFLDSDNHKEYIATHDCGACSQMIADHAGRFARVFTPSTACSSAANAIILGANLIRSGRADIVVAGGAECITKYHLNGFNSLMILDEKPCRPFDATRAGLNLGEGAAYVVLESEDSARRRGASPWCSLSGWGNACDAFHQTASSDNGEGAYLAMKQALEMAALAPCDIDYINAHGTGTPNNDASETVAMKRLFGSMVPAVSSTKSMTGHTTSASGAIEMVICMLALRHSFLPVNVNWANAMPDGIIPVNELKQNIDLSHVLCNSFGFGGNDSSLLISKR